MAKCFHKFKKKVSANSVETFDVLLENGSRMWVLNAMGAANHQSDTRVEVVWDRKAQDGGEILFMTYGTARMEVMRELVGDGVKLLSIVLVNESNKAVTLFGQVFCNDSDGHG